MITDMYSETQRIPTDPYQPLACHCYSRPDSPVKFNSLVETFPGNCIASYTIELRSILWAGFLPESDTENLLLSENCPYPNDASEGTPIKDPLTDLIAYYKSINLTNSSVLRFDPIDVVPYNGVIGPGGGAKVKCYRNSTSEIIAFESRRVFSIEVCGQGFCKGNATSTWYVINESFPCMENRMGPLCGQCRPEYAQTLYSTVSVLQGILYMQRYLLDCPKLEWFIFFQSVHAKWVAPPPPPPPPPPLADFALKMYFINLLSLYPTDLPQMYRQAVAVLPLPGFHTLLWFSPGSIGHWSQHRSLPHNRLLPLLRSGHLPPSSRP